MLFAVIKVTNEVPPCVKTGNIHLLHTLLHRWRSQWQQNKLQPLLIDKNLMFLCKVGDDSLPGGVDSGLDQRTFLLETLLCHLEQLVEECTSVPYSLSKQTDAVCPHQKDDM